MSIERPGASLAFTSGDPIVVEARSLMREGELKSAELLLRQVGEDMAAPREMLDIISRMRIEYGQSAERLFERLREFMADVTPMDLQRWTDLGQVQYKTLDGQRGYFNREPSNIFRFCPEAMARQASKPQAAASWTLESHLARVIAEAKETGRRQVVPIRHQVRFALTVSPDAPGFSRGAVVRVWLPLAQEYRQQENVRLFATRPQGGHSAPSATDDFPLGGAPQRTVYFERRVERIDEPLVFEEVFEFTSSAWYPLLEDAQARPLPSNWRGGRLGERPPHIAFSTELRQIVSQIVGDDVNPLVIARKLFYWIDANIAYHAEEEYSIIPSLCEKAMAMRRGDCGVQAMLYIAMSRCAGIPARWQSGWQTKRVDWNMHDWCEIYIEPWGWLPVDPSYGVQKSDDPAIRDFYFGHQDSYRLIVNRDYGSQLFPPKTSLRSEPLDFQRGEVEIDGQNLYFPHWNYKMEFEWLSDGP